MTELKVPIASDHDGPDWCRLTALWLAQREGSTMLYSKGRNPKVCILHFTDHDERFDCVQDAADLYNVDHRALTNLAWRVKHGASGYIATLKGRAWPELLSKKAKINA